MILKKFDFFFQAVNFFQFLVIKALDSDWILIGIQPKMLNPDPDQMNADPQPLGAGDHAQGTTDRARCCQTGTPRQDTEFSRPAAQHVNPSPYICTRSLYTPGFDPLSTVGSRLEVFIYSLCQHGKQLCYLYLCLPTQVCFLEPHTSGPIY